MPMKPVTVRRWEVLLVFVLLAISFTVGLVLVDHASDKAKAAAHQAEQLSRENRSLIARIQRARLESCERTYEGVREIFAPILPRRARTPKEAHDIRVFNTRVDELKAGCPAQIDGRG